MKDFSRLFQRNETKERLSVYYGSVCAKCGGMCCSYNISPVQYTNTLNANLSDDNMIILKKALLLRKDLRKRFLFNVRRSLTYLEKAGFGKGLLDFAERNRFSLKSIVKAYMLVDKKIAAYNRSILKKDPLDMNNRAVNECIFLLPGKGCILDDCRPFTCVTAFRKCFKKLTLFDYVEGNTHRGTEEEILAYIRADFRIDQEITKPKIIVGASEDLKKKLTKIYREKKPGYFKTLTFDQLAKLADFVVIPFSRIPACLKGMIDRKIFYFEITVKDPPAIIFVDEITQGEPDDSFDFGLDYVQLFEVTDGTTSPQLEDSNQVIDNENESNMNGETPK